ncbi:MAG: hypothetical protein J2P17_20780, partial [Mycobacterium sp.]|nr:hypothetical protein [Mycobacterium sp.]
MRRAPRNPDRTNSTDYAMLRTQNRTHYIGSAIHSQPLSSDATTAQRSGLHRSRHRRIRTFVPGGHLAPNCNASYPNKTIYFVFRIFFLCHCFPSPRPDFYSTAPLAQDTICAAKR